jgi:hypothetical protein
MQLKIIATLLLEAADGSHHVHSNSGDADFIAVGGPWTKVEVLLHHDPFDPDRLERIRRFGCRVVEPVSAA